MARGQQTTTCGLDLAHQVVLSGLQCLGLWQPFGGEGEMWKPEAQFLPLVKLNDIMADMPSFNPISVSVQIL